MVLTTVIHFLTVLEAESQRGDGRLLISEVSLLGLQLIFNVTCGTGLTSSCESKVVLGAWEKQIKDVSCRIHLNLRS